MVQPKSVSWTSVLFTDGTRRTSSDVPDAKPSHSLALTLAHSLAHSLALHSVGNLAQQIKSLLAKSKCGCVTIGAPSTIS